MAEPTSMSCLRWRRSPTMRSLRQELLGMRGRAVALRHPGEHPRQFDHSLAVVQDLQRSHVPLLGHPRVKIGEARYLRG